MTPHSADEEVEAEGGRFSDFLKTMVTPLCGPTLPPSFSCVEAQRLRQAFWITDF